MSRFFATPTSFPPIMTVDELSALSSIVSLGSLRWEIVRAVRRKTVYFGSRRGNPVWVAKVSMPGERGFVRAHAFARLVDDRISAGLLSGVMTCQADRWQIHELPDGRQLLLTPFIRGSAIGIEAILDPSTADSQQRQLGKLVEAIVALDLLDTPPASRRLMGRNLRTVIRDHLRRPVEEGLISAGAASSLLRLASALGAPSRAVAAHNDFAPWHALTGPSGLALIDGEHFSDHSARGVDLAHCAMFMWVTQENSAQARDLVTMTAQVMGLSARELWRDSALVWLRMLAKGFDISVGWNGNAAEARGFAIWALEQISIHAAPRHRALVQTTVDELVSPSVSSLNVLLSETFPPISSPFLSSTID